MEMHLERVATRAGEDDHVVQTDAAVLASLIDDEALLFEAKEIARTILAQDPSLQRAEHQRFARFAVKSDENGTSLAN